MLTAAALVLLSAYMLYQAYGIDKMHDRLDTMFSWSNRVDADMALMRGDTSRALRRSGDLFDRVNTLIDQLDRFEDLQHYIQKLQFESRELQERSLAAENADADIWTQLEELRFRVDDATRITGALKEVLERHTGDYEIHREPGF